MEQTAAHLPDAFTHIRLILGFVISLSLARLLSGLARFVQHPEEMKPDAIHLMWSLSVLILLVHFWWWEFWLGTIATWTFALYAFLLVFALQLFLLAALLYPDNVSEYAGYGDYFMRRRAWFFGVFASVNIFDVIDTLIKGAHHAAQYNWSYWIQAPAYVLLSLVAIFSANRKFHITFIAANLIWQIFFIAEAFSVLG
ncbi:MAG TPA: hypothetical protein VID67_10985 [Rhizomicrobium sp.]|jgi:hypothetical protein